MHLGKTERLKFLPYRSSIFVRLRLVSCIANEQRDRDRPLLDCIVTIVPVNKREGSLLHNAYLFDVQDRARPSYATRSMKYTACLYLSTLCKRSPSRLCARETRVSAAKRRRAPEPSAAASWEKRDTWEGVGRGGRGGGERKEDEREKGDERNEEEEDEKRKKKEEKQVRTYTQRTVLRASVYVAHTHGTQHTHTYVSALEIRNTWYRRITSPEPVCASPPLSRSCLPSPRTRVSSLHPFVHFFLSFAHVPYGTLNLSYTPRDIASHGILAQWNVYYLRILSCIRLYPLLSSTPSFSASHSRLDLRPV